MNRTCLVCAARLLSRNLPPDMAARLAEGPEELAAPIHPSNLPFLTPRDAIRYNLKNRAKTAATPAPANPNRPCRGRRPRALEAGGRRRPRRGPRGKTPFTSRRTPTARRRRTKTPMHQFVVLPSPPPPPAPNARPKHWQQPHPRTPRKAVARCRPARQGKTHAPPACQNPHAPAPVLAPGPPAGSTSPATSLLPRQATPAPTLQPRDLCPLPARRRTGHIRLTRQPSRMPHGPP
jgi:hypothetical protein